MDAGGSRDATRDTSPDTSGDAEGDARDASEAGDAPDAPPAAPYLTSLDIVGTTEAGAGIALTPAFSPTVFDYYVRCASGTNPLRVTITASAGALSALTAPATSKPRAHQTVDVTVLENQAIVVAASAGKLTTEYWVRCLPSDFPPLKIVPQPGAPKPAPGYYLVGTAKPTGPNGYAMALDTHAVPVWYMHARPPLPGSTTGCAAGDVDNLLPNTITFFSNQDQPVEIFKLGPPLVQSSAAPMAEVMDSHELRVLKNGDFLVPSNPMKTGVDLTGLSLMEGKKTVSLGPKSNILNCNLVEFDPATGEVKWKWIGTDHLDAAKDTLEMQLSGDKGPGGGPVLDAFHCNSIDVDSAGNLLVSARDMDSLFYIEKATGRILWKLGGSTYTKDDATYIPVDDPFYTQHDARFAPGWSPCTGGQITLFDDRTGHTGAARAIVMDVVVASTTPADGGAPDGGPTDDAADGELPDAPNDAGPPDGPEGDAAPPPACDAGPPPAPSAKVSWRYPGLASSLSRGSFRISPDGSRVVGWGNNGVPGLLYSEVDDKGHDLVDVYFADGDVSYRAIKVPLDAFDIETLRKTAGSM